MELTELIKIALPVSLALIMLSMGLTLKLEDFQRVIFGETRKAFTIGFTLQMLFVPLLALLLLQIFELNPLLAVGLMVLSFSPGGTTSNLFSYMAKGDVALSVTLTGMAAVITPFTIPVLTEMTLQMQLGESRDVSIPVLLTMKRLIIVTVMPLAIGMVWRYFYTQNATRVHYFLHRFSTILFLLVILTIIKQQSDLLPFFLQEVGFICLLMMIAAMGIAYIISRLFGVDIAQQKTISIEVGMQHGGMALIVTQTVLENTTMSIVPVIYGLLMLIPVVLVVLFSSGVRP